MEQALVKLYNAHNTFTVTSEKFKIVSFDFPKMKNVVVFPVKLICCIVFESASNSFCLFKYLLLSCYNTFEIFIF